MINALREHVRPNIKNDGRADTETDAEDEEEEDEEEEDTEEETDAPDELDEDEATLHISSDEEAELEAQRISLQELIGTKLLPVIQRADSRRRSFSSSGASSVVASERSLPVDMLPKKQQQITMPAKKRRCQQRINSSCSGSGSSLVIPPSRTEACGNVYVYQKHQKLLFHCRFCQLRCSDMQFYTRHLLNEHKLFHDDALPATTDTPQRKSTRNLAKTDAAAADGDNNALVKIESDEEYDTVLLETCGSISVLNRKKLFLNCAYCECKYAELELFYKHLRRQHDVFAAKPSAPAETAACLDVEPKREVKTELELLVAPAPQSNGRLVRAHSSSPLLGSSTSQPVVTIPDGKQMDKAIVSPALTAQTPETPPPEEEERVVERLGEKVGGQLALCESAESGVEAVAVKANRCDAKQKNTRVEVTATAAAAVVAANETKTATKAAATAAVAPIEKQKRKRVLPAKRGVATAPTVAVTRPRRTSSAQKSYKDFFAEQQPPSSPESQSSARVAIATRAGRPSATAVAAPTTTSSSSTVDAGNGTPANMAAPAATAASTTTTNGSRPANPLLRYPCDQCNKAYNKLSRLSEHQRLHTGEKPFRCDECGKRFRMKMRLTEHKLRHRKEKAFKCDLCGMGMSTKQDLTLHQRHHSGDRRHQCTQCDKAFVRGSDLKIHMRVHTGEKPFVCEVCQKTFRANQNLIVHRRSHMGERKFKCELCDKFFMRNIDRKVHLRTHTGEKPYKCEICQHPYSSRVHVRTHIEREHMGHVPRPRQRPGPKPKRLKEELAKQQQLIADMQQQLRNKINANGDAAKQEGSDAAKQEAGNAAAAAAREEQCDDKAKCGASVLHKLPDKVEKHTSSPPPPPPSRIAQATTTMAATTKSPKLTKATVEMAAGGQPFPVTVSMQVQLFCAGRTKN